MGLLILLGAGGREKVFSRWWAWGVKGRGNENALNRTPAIPSG